MWGKLTQCKGSHFPLIPVGSDASGLPPPPGCENHPHPISRFFILFYLLQWNPDICITMVPTANLMQKSVLIQISVDIALIYVHEILMLIHTCLMQISVFHCSSINFPSSSRRKDDERANFFLPCVHENET